MRLPRITLPVLAALLLGAPTAGAQTIPSPIRYIEPTQSVSGFAGYLWTDPALNVTDTVTLDLGPRSAPVVGARYSARLSGGLYGDVSLGFAPTKRRLFVPEETDVAGVIAAVDTGEDLNVSLLMADAGLRFALTGPRTWHRLAPYVLGMAGLVTDLSRATALEAELEEGERFDFGPAFAVGVGLGTDWFPADRVSIRLEAQNRLWRMGTPEGFTGRAARREWNAVLGLTAGAAIHF